MCTLSVGAENTGVLSVSIGSTLNGPNSALWWTVPHELLANARIDMKFSLVVLCGELSAECRPSNINTLYVSVSNEAN